LVSVSTVEQELHANSKSDQVILAETARLERDYPTQKIEPANFESLFEERLSQYDDDRSLISTERSDQDAVVARLREANTAFSEARRGDTSTRSREQALQRLENGYTKYKEIVTNLNTGRKFYNDLAKIVNRFRDECQNFAYQRRVEAGQLEEELANAMSALSIGQNQGLEEQRQRGLLREQYGVKVPKEEPLTAPVPKATATGMWNPEMGIRFGAPPAQQQPQQQQDRTGIGNVHNPAYPNTARPRAPGQWEVSQGVRFG